MTQKVGCVIINLEMGDLCVSVFWCLSVSLCSLDQKIPTFDSGLGEVSFVINLLLTWFLKPRVIKQLNPFGSIFCVVLPFL